MKCQNCETTINDENSFGYCPECHKQEEKFIKRQEGNINDLEIQFETKQKETNTTMSFDQFCYDKFNNLPKKGLNRDRIHELEDKLRKNIEMKKASWNAGVVNNRINPMDANSICNGFLDLQKPKQKELTMVQQMNVEDVLSDIQRDK